MGDSLSELEGSPTTASPSGSGDSLSQLEAQASPSTGSKPNAPYSPSAGKWYSGLDDVANSTIDAVKGAANGAVNTVLHPINTAKSAAAAVAAIPGQVAQVPSAIHEINQGVDPTGTYLNVAKDTADQGAGQALTAIGTEGLGKAAAGTPVETVARTGVKMVKDAASDIPVVKTVLKTNKLYNEAAAETAARKAGSAPPAFPTYDAPEATPSASEPTQTAAPKSNEAAAPKDNVHPDAAEFEKTFGVPIDNYVDGAGKFNKTDFLNEVVKPKTEPPASVIAKQFGNDGNDLVTKLNGGEPLAKWESSAPADVPKGGSARLAIKDLLKGETGSAGAPGTINETYAGRAPQVLGTKMMPASKYLKSVGADESSVVNNATRSPQDHMNSINYHQDQIRSGKGIEPVEYHVDEDLNPIGADGRHRALAAIREGGKDVKIPVKVIKFSTQGL